MSAYIRVWLDELDAAREGAPPVCQRCRHADWHHIVKTGECFALPISGPECQCPAFEPDPVPVLTARLRAVFAECDELDVQADYYSLAASGSHDNGMHHGLAYASDRIRAAAAGTQR